jgi:hypothetical protein
MAEVNPFYEELLTLGSHLCETERVTLYKFFLLSKRENYLSAARELLRAHELKREIANGEILYTLSGNFLTYSAKRKNESDYIENLRTLKLSKISKFRKRQIVKFFSQADVDVIWNYPLQGDHPHEDCGFTIMTYPYFDLRYFAEGKGWIFGLINKSKFVDSEMLHMLGIE